MNILEMNHMTKQRLTKVVAINDYNSKIERVFEFYGEAKAYALTLEAQGFIVMFEPLPVTNFKDLAQKYLDQLKDKDIVVENYLRRIYV